MCKAVRGKKFPKIRPRGANGRRSTPQYQVIGASRKITHQRGAVKSAARQPQDRSARSHERETSLHGDDGFLLASTQAALARLDTADARAECRAQIETTLAWGLNVTHLDAHMNVMQARADLHEVYLDLAEEFRLPVRMFSREETERQGFQAAHADIRAHDAECLTDPAVLALLEQHAIKRISYRELRELQRAS